MKAFQILLVVVLWINASFSQTTKVKKEKIDSIVRIINCMKLKADSIYTISSDSLVADHIICYYDKQKKIYRIEVTTIATSVDSRKHSNVVTLHNVYYYHKGFVINIDSNWFYSSSLTNTGHTYFDKGHLIYSTNVNDDVDWNELLAVQAMKYYRTFSKQI